MAGKKPRKSVKDEKQNNTEPIASAETKAPLPENASIEDKLKAAAGNITKAHASSRTRKSEEVKRQIQSQKDAQARLAEAERRREENEKYASKVVEQKLAAFDYAQNYRKKLLRDKEKMVSAAKLRAIEEREAREQGAKEARAQEIATILDNERQEAKERAERADKLLQKVRGKGDAVQTDTEDEAIDVSAVTTDDVADVGSDGGAPASDTLSDNESAVPENTEAVQDEDVAAEADAEKSDVTDSADDAEDATDADGEQDAADEETDDSEGVEPDGETGDDNADGESDDDGDGTEDGEDDYVPLGKYKRPPRNPRPSLEDIKARKKAKSASDDSVPNELPPRKTKDDLPRVSEDDLEHMRTSFAESHERRRLNNLKNKRNEKARTVLSFDETVTIHDDIVAMVKAEGENVTYDKKTVRKYIKQSKSAIRYFEAALREGRKALAENADERDAPIILVGIMKILGKLLEVRANNLEVFVRLKSYRHTQMAKEALHREIERYNDYALTYSLMTGEQLTRMSSFLPEHIYSGKALAVVPQLVYKEQYAEIYRESYDESVERDEKSIALINPELTARGLLGKTKKLRGRLACAGFKRRAKSAAAKIDKQIERMRALILDNNANERKYERELKKLRIKTPPDKRDNAKYKNKVFKVSLKYGKRLTTIKTVKASSAFERTKIRLLIGCLALEREKLEVAAKLLHGVYRVGSPAQKGFAESFFVTALMSYNRCAAECSEASGASFRQLSSSLVERVCREDEEIRLPEIAYQRELYETVGGATKSVSMHLQSEVAPYEAAYLENSQKILSKKHVIDTKSAFELDSPSVDRATALATVTIDTLADMAARVTTKKDFSSFVERSERAEKHFKATLKRTEKAIAKAFDENGVVSAVVESIRVLSNLIEVRRIGIALASKIGDTNYALAESKALYKNIERYNGRAIDYMSLVGDQFTRISGASPRQLLDVSENIRIPEITYKDNYIEVFPKDPLDEAPYEKPAQRRGGYYTPLLMHHYRLTENNSVETSIVNAPFVYDATINDDPVISWWVPKSWDRLLVIFQPIVAVWRRFRSGVEIFFIDASLVLTKSALDGRRDKYAAKRKKLENKLKALNDAREKKILRIETTIQDSDRNSVSYQRRIHKINRRFTKKIYKLKMKNAKLCPERRDTRFLLEKLVLEREQIIGANKLLIKFRNYGRLTFFRNVNVRYKKRFLGAVNSHNETAKKLSKIVGTPFSEVSPTVADEIIRYGKVVKFPQIVCCREIIETIDGMPRSVGDKWHGFGLYGGAPSSMAAHTPSPIMSVGAMGYSTDMGIPYLRADFSGMTIIGMTPAGVPLIGFTDNGETDIPFMGVPLMVSGDESSPVLDAGVIGHDAPLLGGVNATNPYAAMNSRSLDAEYLRAKEEEAKLGVRVELPVALDAKLVEERFIRSLKARSMTTIDGVRAWWKLFFAEINMMLMRNLFFNEHEVFLGFLLPKRDPFLERISAVKGIDDPQRERIVRLAVILDIEFKRLYTAAKTGIRRSLRVWNAWLHRDIATYNNLVNAYNEGKPRNTWIETVSLSVPEEIIHRLKDRPPDMSTLCYRNRVIYNRNAKPIRSDDILDRLYEYIRDELSFRAEQSGFIKRFFIKRKIAGLAKKKAQLDALGYKDNAAKKRQKRNLAVTLEKQALKISTRAYIRREQNENRHYHIRFEKARVTKRYNHRVFRVSGNADNHIKYQASMRAIMRKYIASIFRIDYNMRIRQIIQRALTPLVFGFDVYAVGTVLFAATLAVLAFLMVDSAFVTVLTTVALIWALFPVVMLVMMLIYNLILFIANIVMWTRNTYLPKYGAKDIEDNRNELILDCFVAEQYKLLAACERVQSDPRSHRVRKDYITAVNDYNRARKKYSDILRVPIVEVEPTALLDKLISGNNAELTELQDFVFRRELIERVDKHKVGSTLTKKQLSIYRSRLNELIVLLNNSNLSAKDRVFYGGRITSLIRDVDSGTRLTEDDKYEYKRDIVALIDKLSAPSVISYSNYIDDVKALLHSLSKDGGAVRLPPDMLREHLDKLRSFISVVNQSNLTENSKDLYVGKLYELMSAAQLVNDPDTEESFKSEELLKASELKKREDELVNFINHVSTSSLGRWNAYATDVVNLVNYLGGLDERRILDVLATDDMIRLNDNPKDDPTVSVAARERVEHRNGEDYEGVLGEQNLVKNIPARDVILNSTAIDESDL